MDPTILIVEDEAGIRDMIRFALEQKQFRVVTADSANAANDILIESVVDAALTIGCCPALMAFSSLNNCAKMNQLRNCPLS